MKLYHYYRSSASYRVRIALNYKNLNYERIPIHLTNHGGEQYLADYRQLNPQQLVPVLQIDTITLAQSTAIIEYLEECYPTPALLPQDLIARSVVRGIAQTIACEIHPLNNLRVLRYLTDTLSIDETQQLQWYHHWLQLGFDALEQRLQTLPRQQAVCYGDSPSLGDVYLIPQIYNAHRFNFSMAAYPLLMSIYEHCSSLPAFAAASPENNQ